MKTEKLVSIALFSALLAACSSSGGASLNEIPMQYRSAVSQEKTIHLVYSEKNGDTFNYTLNGKTGEYNFSTHPNGRANLPINLIYKNAQSGNTGNLSGTMLVYQQPYSVVTGTTWTRGTGDYTGSGEKLNIFEADQRLGLSTPDSALIALNVNNATFKYTGVAFDGKEQGTLSYTMDFGINQGNGSITGLTHTGTINLQSAPLKSEDNEWFIHGVADIANDSSRSTLLPPVGYRLSFFGPHAEELSGVVSDPRDDQFLGDDDIIFAGKR